MNADKDLLALAGVEALRLVSHHDEVPASPEGKGLTDLAWLVANAVWLSVGEVDAHRSPACPALLRVPEGQVAQVLAGDPREHDGALYFDTTGKRVVLRVLDLQGRPLLIDARDGAVDVWDAGDALAGMEPEIGPPPPIPDADVQAWAQAAGAEPWLSALAGDLLAPATALERVAAVGLLSRLWTAPDGAELAPELRPSARARAWVQGLSDEQLVFLETEAVERAWTLSERLESLSALDEDTAELEAQNLVLDRDDLQSVRRVLRLAGRGERLSEALAALDRRASEHLSALANQLPPVAGSPDEDRWHAVAWQEPDCWWTGLA